MRPKVETAALTFARAAPIFAGKHSAFRQKEISGLVYLGLCRLSLGLFLQSQPSLKLRRCGYTFRVKRQQPILVLFGVATIGSYGLIVNSMDWEFSTIFGVYVALFASTAILFRQFVFRENIPATTWMGLAFILVGGLIIQFGSGH